MLGTKPQLQYYHHLLQSVIGSFTHCQLFSISVPPSTQNDRRLTNLREIYRLFHYRLDTGYISDKLSVSMEQWHIRHAMSNVVFLVLTGISLGFSSWCFEDPAILVRPFSSQVLAVQECVCVGVCVYTLQGSTMEAWQHQQDKGDKKIERDRMRQYIWKIWMKLDSETTDPLWKSPIIN